MQRDENAHRDADLASLIHMGSKVWEGDGVEVTPEQVLKTLLGELFVEDAFLSDVRDLAEGGFATVQSAHLTHPNGMKQLVAIKRLRPERLGSEESLTEFIAVRQSDSSPGFEHFARRHCTCDTGGQSVEEASEQGHCQAHGGRRRRHGISQQYKNEFFHRLRVHGRRHPACNHPTTADVEIQRRVLCARRVQVCTILLRSASPPIAQQ